MTRYTIPCPNCSGAGKICLGHPMDPWTPVRTCRECEGEGEVERELDAESAIAMKAITDWTDALTALVNEGHWLCDAKDIARDYGLAPKVAAPPITSDATRIDGRRS